MVEHVLKDSPEAEAMAEMLHSDMRKSPNCEQFLGDPAAHMVVDVHHSGLLLLCWRLVAHCAEQHLRGRGTPSDMGHVSGALFSACLLLF